MTPITNEQAESLRTVRKTATAPTILELWLNLNAELVDVLEEAEHDLRQRARPGQEWLDKARAVLTKAKGTS